MRWKLIFSILAVLVAVLGITMYVILSSYDLNDLKPKAVQAVKDATGRELTLAGDVKLDIGLTPALVVNDVSLQNAPWGSRAEMVKIKRLEVRVAILPLISGTIEIKRLVLVEPDILIETNKSGKSNLQFKTAGEGRLPEKKEHIEAQGKSQSLPLVFNSIRIEKGRLTYRDGLSDRVYDLTLDKATVVSGLDSPVELKLKGSYNNKACEITGAFGRLAELIDPDKPWSVKLKAKMAGSTLKVNGNVTNILNGTGLDITAHVKGKSVPEILKLFNVTDVPDVGPFEVSGRLTDSSGRLAITDLDLNVGPEKLATVSLTGSIEDLISFQGITFLAKAKGQSVPGVFEVFNITGIPDLGPFKVSGHVADHNGRWSITDLELEAGTKELTSIKLKGTVKDLTTIQGIDLDFSIKGNNAANLEPITGQTLPLEGPFSLSGHAFCPSEKVYKITDLKASVQKSRFEGTGTLNLEAKRPLLTVTLRSQVLNLSPILLGEPDKKTDSPAKIAQSASRGNKVFPETPLPLEGLNRINADIEIEAEQLLMPMFCLKDFAGRILLKNGHLTIRPLEFMMANGTFDGHFELEPTDKAPTIMTTFQIDGLDLGDMFEELGVKNILDGIFDIEVDLRGQGASVAQLMAGLNGKTTVIMKDGNMDERLLDLLGADLTSGLLKLLNPFKKKPEYTKINCFVVGLDIQEGLAQSTALLLDTNQVTVIGRGKANLKTEELDLSLKPSPKKGLGIKGLAKLSLSLGQLTKPLKLTGTFAKPSLTIDPTETILALGKAVGGAALFGPVGIAAALAGGKLGDRDPCLAAIEAVKKDSK
ncbi:MAG: AsmA family protein [Deltaproteobacteria bacterium]|nr:AsmA family protein [Deltaproteobacteria bacterium]